MEHVIGCGHPTFGTRVAALAGTDSVDDAHSRFGLAFGEAFQHRDDLLGVFGLRRRRASRAANEDQDQKMTLLARASAWRIE